VDTSQLNSGLGAMLRQRSFFMGKGDRLMAFFTLYFVASGYIPRMSSDP
jgi:hypothetical protein